MREKKKDRIDLRTVCEFEPKFNKYLLCSSITNT